jgi:hypothetical protein
MDARGGCYVIAIADDAMETPPLVVLRQGSAIRIATRAA